MSDVLDRERWEREPWMNDDQWECMKMLSDLCGGSHHIGGKVRESGQRGIAVNLRFGFNASTFDYNGLTKAVVLAHDRCIRFEISPSGPGMLHISLHRRFKRDGQMHERHPELEDAIASIRKVEIKS